MKWRLPQKLIWFIAGILVTLLISYVLRPRHLNISFPTPNGEEWYYHDKTTQRWTDSKGANWITHQESNLWDSASREEVFDFYTDFLAKRGWRDWNDCHFSPENLFFQEAESLTRGMDYYLYRKDNEEEDFDYTRGHIVVVAIRNKSAGGYNVRIFTENPSILSALGRGL